MSNFRRTTPTALIAAFLLAACGPAATPAPTPTEVPSPTATVIPSATPSPTVTPIPTATPLPTATRRPTATPRPSPTPQPTLPPGWVLIEGDGVSMQMPEGFAGGKLTDADIDIQVKAIKQLGKDYTQIADNLKNYQSLYVLWAYDSNVKPGRFLTNCGVAQAPILSALKLKTVANQLVASFPKEFKVTSQEDFTVAAYSEARKLLIDATFFGMQIKEVVYLLKDKGTVWIIFFATSAAELEEHSAVFDQIVQTFAVMP